MLWILKFATEIASVAAFVSVASAIAGFLHSAGTRRSKNAIVVTLNGTREEFANLDSRQVEAIMSELSRARSDHAPDPLRNPQLNA